MQADIEAILGQNPFYHISYIILPPKIVLLVISNYLVCMLVSMHQHYLMPIPACIIFDYPCYGCFDMYCSLRYLVIRHLLNSHPRIAKKVSDSTHLLCQLLVTMISILNQGIEHCAYLACKNVNHFVITLIHLLSY